MRKALYIIIAIMLLTGRASAQTIESLYVDSSVSSRPIASETNSRGAADGLEASVTGKLANLHTWTFDFDTTVNAGFPITTAEIFITHRQSGLSNDSLVLEYFDGTSFVVFESMANAPTTLTTVGPFSASLITSSTQLNGFQIQMRGVSKIGSPDNFTYFVDAIELRVTFQTNDPPVLSAIGAKSVTEGQLLSFTVSATDPDLTTPVLTAASLPSGASYVDNNNGTASFNWTPGFLESGTFNVTFYATDDSAAVDSEVVTITVNEAGNQLPVLATIGAQSTNENVNLNFSVSATDVESTPTLTTSALPTGATFTPSAGGGTFDWTPSFIQAGVFSVTFYATDDSAAVDSEVVTITVTEVGNQLPVLAAIGAQSTNENVNLNFSVSSTDAESTPVVTTSALPGGATFTPSAGGGTFDWTPSFIQAGVFSVTFYATDDSAAVDSEVVTITVNEVGNQLPVLAAIGAKSTNENVNLNFSVSSTDVESTPVVTTSALPGGATFTPSAGGGTFDWTPGFIQPGVFSVTFYATDDSAAVDSEVVTITVTEVGNQLPVLAAIGAQSTNENVNLNFIVSATDAESTPVVTTSALPTGATFTPFAGGGTFDWTPGFIQSGVFSVTFYATDDSAAVDSEVVTITVTEVGNQLPVLAAIGAKSTNENVNLNFSVSATDVESTPTLTTSALPTGATFTPSAGGGTFDWTPSFIQAGVFSVTFYATDDSAAVDSEVVTITVTEVGNQLPVLAAIGAKSTNENVNLNFVVSSSDAESVPVVTTSALPVGATFTPSAGGGTFDWTPSFIQSGVFSVTLYATDDSAAVDSEVVTITVTEVGNQLPVLATIGAQSTNENVNLNFVVSSSDAESVPVVTTSALPAGATFTPSAGGGTFDWTPSFIQSGVFSVTLYATDDSA
ncbi:MAG: hypothetical protein IIB00_03250, partial [candidate division Zixibacteria bacterium]|nr:hypothetical protein [candidate division Zixibacteria bacterium]